MGSLSLDTAQKQGTKYGERSSEKSEALRRR